MSKVRIPKELLDLAMGRELKVGDTLDLRILDKVVLSYTVKEVHDDDSSTLEAYAINEKTYEVRLPNSMLQKAPEVN